MPYKFNPFTGNLDIEGPVLTGSGTVSAAADGTQSIPGISFASDLNTGIYRPGADQLAISTGGTERARIDSSGNVGIGTTSVAAKLQVSVDNDHTDQGNTLAVRGTSGSWAAHLGATSEGGALVARGYAITKGSLIFGATDGSYASYTERARIDSSGRLLIGTSSALSIGGNHASFQVESSPSILHGGSFVRHGGTNPIAGGAIAIGRSRGTSAGAVTAVENNDTLGYVLFSGANGTDYSNNAAWISCQVDGTPGANDMPGRLVFSTTADGASSPTEAMRITSDRYVRLASGTGGIQFNGDTAAANALDDYEEGTWTPVFIGTSTAGTPTYGSNGQAGKYTKVGNKVTAWAFINVTALGGAAGNINITGLPFAIDNTGFGNSGISVGHADGALGNSVRAYHNTTFLELRNNNSVVTAATGQIYVSVIYTN